MLEDVEGRIICCGAHCVWRLLGKSQRAGSRYDANRDPVCIVPRCGVAYGAGAVDTVTKSWTKQRA